MAHRGMPDHGPRWKLARNLLVVLALAALASLLFILGSELVHGSVTW